MSNLMVYTIIMIFIIVGTIASFVMALNGKLKYILLALLLIGLFFTESAYGVNIINEGARRNMTIAESFNNQEIHNIAYDNVIQKIDEAARKPLRQ